MDWPETKDYKYVEFDRLVGKTVTKITGVEYCEELRFFTSDGEEYVMHHVQDCCECVSLEDVCGDINDLLDSPILSAYESSNSREVSTWDECETWTFYNISTIKGFVTLRWLGKSNGYYSEEVDFCRKIQDKEKLTEAFKTKV